MDTQKKTLEDTLHTCTGDGRRIDVLLAEATGMTRSRIANLMYDGH